MDLMKRVDMLLKERGITRAQALREMDLPHSTFDRWVNSKMGPNVSIVARVADYLNVSVDYLLGNEAPPREGVRRIPVYGRIPAGIPLEAIEDITDFEEEWEYRLQPDKEYVALIVRGDSMSPVYLNGDIVIVRLQDYADTGDDAVVFVNNDDATLKRISRSEKGLTLKPMNNEFEPMFFTPEEAERLPVKIFGIVVQLRRNIRG